MTNQVETKQSYRLCYVYEDRVKRRPILSEMTLRRYTDDEWGSYPSGNRRYFSLYLTNEGFP